MSRIPKKIGLAMGSGGARGWAHIGVIEALREHGVEIECVAGSSMGALVGAVYASDKLDVFSEVARRLDWQQVLYHFFEVSFPRAGLIDGTKIASFVRRFVQSSDIGDLSIPFAAVATDLNTGAEFTVDTGDVIEAVRASIAVPGIFTPVSKDGHILVDGGLVNPIPVNVARKMGAEFVIAVDVSHIESGCKPEYNRAEVTVKKKQPSTQPDDGDLIDNILSGARRRLDALDETARSYIRQLMKQNVLPNIFEVLANSIRIVEAKVAESRLKVDPPDMLIRPRVGHLGFMEFHKATEAIRQGRQAMSEAIEQYPRKPSTRR